MADDSEDLARFKQIYETEIVLTEALVAEGQRRGLDELEATYAAIGVAGRTAAATLCEVPFFKRSAMRQNFIESFTAEMDENFARNFGQPNEEERQ